MANDRLKKSRLRRRYHLRKKVFGTSDRPRLAVYRSNRHIYAQIIDDVAGATLISASTRGKTLRGKLTSGGNSQGAGAVGEELSRQALKVGIKCVRFDRNRFSYHGRTKALAEAARKGGLVF